MKMAFSKFGISNNPIYKWEVEAPLSGIGAFVIARLLSLELFVDLEFLFRAFSSRAHSTMSCQFRCPRYSPIEFLRKSWPFELCFNAELVPQASPCHCAPLYQSHPISCSPEYEITSDDFSKPSTT